MMQRKVLPLVCACLLFASSAFASVQGGDEHGAIDKAGRGLAGVATGFVEDGHGAIDKAGRGLAGVATGFLEVPGNIAAVDRDQGDAAAATIGVAKGLAMFPVRELVGLYEFVTSPIPVPGDYRPIIEPEYPWQYFEGADSARVAVP
jgi:putative exosortase-associated protein (TIGR04073 family)